MEIEIPSKLRLRCPECAKLYEVEAQEIKSMTPHFKCFQCHTVFTLNRQQPWSAEEMIPTFVVNLGAEKECIKCGKPHPRSAQVCPHCQIIFERLLSLPADKSLGATPRLVKKWQELLEHFEKDAYHDDFIRNCLKEKAVKFALIQYQKMNEVLGGDSLCKNRIAELSSPQIEAPVASTKYQDLIGIGLDTSLDWLKVHWQRLLYLIPLFIGLILIMVGYSNSNLRNMVGTGVSLIFLNLGVILIIRGKISI